MQWGLILGTLLSVGLLAESTKETSTAAIDSANASLIQDTQRSVDVHDAQLATVIGITHKYQSEYADYVMSTDQTLSMSDSEIHQIAWSGGKVPVLSPTQADYANQLAEQFVSMQNFCINAVTQDQKIRYPSFIHKTYFDTKECM